MTQPTLNLPAIAEPAIKMHDYQRFLVQELRNAYRDDQYPCLVLPTGGGKTVISAGLARSSQNRERRVWFICHRDFLVSQTSATFKAMGVEHGILAAGYPEGMMPTMVVSIDTLRSRLHKIGVRPDVMVWDECHHLAAATWTKVWEWAGSECFHMGLTATPCRLDGRGLAPSAPGKPGFTRMILGPSTGELMAMKNLSAYRAFAPTTFSAQGIGKTAGDYNKRQLKKAINEQVIVGDIIEHYERLALGKRMIYFCVSVEYSQRLAAAFTAKGYPARHLDARDNTATRMQAARDFATGKLAVLTNVGLFGEGYDLAAQAGMPVTVEGVGLVRPTMSESLAIQMMGRCLRAKSYPGIIIDHAGVINAHGLPDTDRDWTLQGRGKEKRPATVKVCPSCLATVRISCSECENCGHSFAKAPTGGRPDPVHKPGQLVEVDAKTFNERRRSWSAVVGSCKTYADFRKAGEYLGYKPGWAHYAWREFQQHGFVRRRGNL